MVSRVQQGIGLGRGWAFVLGAVLALIVYGAFMRSDAALQLEPRRPDAWVHSSSGGLPMDHVQPTAAMTRWLLHGDANEPLDETLLGCFRDPRYLHLPRSRWFVSVPLPVIAQYPQRQLHFVRPALVPFCMYFHGAHTFTYWIVQEVPSEDGPVFSLLDMQAADWVAVLHSHHEGVYDVERGVCTATQCTYKTQQRSGDSFKFGPCRREHYAQDGALARTELLRCEDVGW